MYSTRYQPTHPPALENDDSIIRNSYTHHCYYLIDPSLRVTVTTRIKVRASQDTCDQSSSDEDSDWEYPTTPLQ